MSELEPLQRIARLRFFTNNVENGIDEFSSFRVMSFGPVVSRSRLPEDEIVRTENLPIGA
jgi:hypothetical protein